MFCIWPMLLLPFLFIIVGETQTMYKPRELCGKVSFCLMHVFPGIKKKKKKIKKEEEEED